MKKLVASFVALALTVAMAPVNLIAAARFQAGTIAGVATVDGKPLANVTVRLRNIDTGQLVGNTTANAQGSFSFSGLGAGNFVVETVAANGTILGTSTTIALAAGAMAATGITVATSGTALAAAGGVGAGAAAAGAGAGAAAGAAGGGVAAGAAAGGGVLAAVGGTVGAVAIAGGIIGVTTLAVVANDASPSR
jgi:hypothetical protein